ncbi:NADPH-dependent FMN reductase [Mesorhizobium sp. KR9-304]|uniref:NADPH-dependent FMN reductase n=1 Tax=Mesorhizobium sp. KR9-304 TaxID=3156614 RepID=UPI0032B46590
MNFLGLSGSLRAVSTNSALLLAMRDCAPDGCRLEIYDGLGKLPIFNPDDEQTPTAEVLRLADLVGRSDGIVIACPEYAHGVPGGLKNALDWLVSGEAAVGKPAMLVHASPRSLTSRTALREILNTMSFDVFAGDEFEIALLGKKPEDVEAMLAATEARRCMQEMLVGFQRFASRH